MLNDLAEAADRYVTLVLAVGVHDVDYVDAYYGPPEQRARAEAARQPLDEIDRDAADVLTSLTTAGPPATGDDLVRLRYHYLTRQLESLRSRVALLQGRRLTFDEESLALYDAVAPRIDAAVFDAAIEELGRRLPGRGSVLERYDAYRQRLVIPRDRLDATFTAAIEAGRARTHEHIALPDDERFDVEYVTDKSWSGYNWYQGGYHSLIQVNTDLPIYIDRAIDLACHEGYPGHHVYNVLLEHHLVRARGWTEFSVYALFSPQSLIAEGTANFGIEVALPREERLELERTVIFPAAGLDASLAEEYYDILALVDRLSYAGNEVARRYVDGEIDAQAAAEWLERYALYSPPRARQRVRFIQQYRSYVINYNLGKDLVRSYVESQTGTANEVRRWKVFEELISSPRLPSGLIKVGS
ncbi:MAG TPA: hypothetical protein VFB85_20740 [Vicinamibacterales bacterium]|nr:hypothetical protein [Vicinamibacterales bacterium]